MAAVLEVKKEIPVEMRFLRHSPRMQRQKTIRLLVVTSAVLLIGASLLHTLAGYPRLSQALSGTNLRPPVVAVLEVFWITVSVHWVVAAALAVLAGFRRMEGTSVLLVLAAFLPGIDGLAGLVRLGPFVGNFLLLTPSALLVVAAVLRCPAKTA